MMDFNVGILIILADRKHASTIIPLLKYAYIKVIR